MPIEIKKTKALAFINQEQNYNLSTILIPNNKHFIEHFIELKASKSVHTAKAYEKDIIQFFNVAVVKDITLEDIKKVNILHAEQWILFMKDKGVASSTINRKISSLSGLYKWLLKYADNSSDFQLIKYNPFSALKEEKPKVINKKTEFLTQLEVKRLLSIIDTSTITGFRNKLIVCLMLTTAIRKSELINIKIGDIKTFGNFNIISIIGKGAKERGIKIQPKVKNLIDEYLKMTDRTYEGNKENYLFIGHSNSHNGTKLNACTLNETISRMCTKAGINKVLTVHSLRHTSITLAIENGSSPEKVRDFAGHENIATTNRYIHNTNQYKDYAGDNIDIL